MTNEHQLNILPLAQKALLQEDKFPVANAHDEFAGVEGVMFFENAKKAIHNLLQFYNITRSDEVYISSTSNSNYVSSCVTCTIFNYGKPSRVITEKTKMIYIINEFGFQNPNLQELRVIANEMNIPLVEDSAHSISSHLNNNKIESISDFVLFSLPKFLPVSYGGIMFDRFNTLPRLENANLQKFSKTLSSC